MIVAEGAGTLWKKDPVTEVRALRQAIDAVMQGIKVSDYAEEHEELKTTLTK